MERCSPSVTSPIPLGDGGTANRKKGWPGADVHVKRDDGKTPLDNAKHKTEVADFLRKHGGKTGEELKAEGK